MLHSDTVGWQYPGGHCHQRSPPLQRRPAGHSRIRLSRLFTSGMNLYVAAEWGPGVLFCISNRTNCVLLVSVMAGCWTLLCMLHEGNAPLTVE
jgi:hypothetical protein